MSQNHIAQLAAAAEQSAERIRQLEATRADHGEGRRRQFTNMKHMEPKHFAGKDEENYKDWAKLLKNFLNTQKKGFTKALEWAEEHHGKIDNDDIELMSWEQAAEANEALYDYLCN